MNETTEQIYDRIRKTLYNFCGAARYSLGRNWRHMTPSQQRNAARALIFMAHVAQNPELYFSRAATMDRWIQHNAQVEVADFKNEPFRADKLNTSPADTISAKVWNAFEYALPLHYDYVRFCNAVIGWEYDRTSMWPARQRWAYVHINDMDELMQESDLWRVRHPKGWTRSRNSR